MGMSEEQLGEYLPQYPQSSQVPQGAEYSSSNKLAWLTTVLYKKLFYPYSADTSQLINVISKMPAHWYPYRQYGRTMYSVSMISGLFKVPLTQEVISAIPVVPGHNPNASVTRNIGYVRRFLQAHPDRWEKTLVFIHGSLRTDKEISINHVAGGFPVAHTCFGSLDVKPYETYEQFEREFMYAMDNTSGLHLA
jgi:hypothetical protein